MNWTDATTYTRKLPGQPEQKQTSWEFKTPALTIHITNDHRLYPGTWVIHCFEVGVSAGKLNIPFDSTPEHAQEIAIRAIKKKLEKMINSFPSGQ